MTHPNANLGTHRHTNVTVTVTLTVQDLHGMIDAAKYADLVLLMVDGGFGFEMETFEFLNLLQVCSSLCHNSVGCPFRFLVAVCSISCRNHVRTNVHIPNALALHADCQNDFVKACSVSADTTGSRVFNAEHMHLLTAMLFDIANIVVLTKRVSCHALCIADCGVIHTIRLLI